jgi:hypothetical protein
MHPAGSSQKIEPQLLKNWDLGWFPGLSVVYSTGKNPRNDWELL